MGDYYNTHNMHVHDDVLYTARGCNTFYDSFDDCWFAKHCSISVFKMSRPTDFQNVLKHFQIPQFMKSLKVAHFLHLACQGAARTPAPPSVTPLHMAKHINMVGSPVWWRARAPCPPKSGAGSENRMQSPSTFCLPPSAVFQQLL